MSVPTRIRTATAEDAQAILEIYAPFCALDSAVSFEIEAPAIEDMRQRIVSTLENFPWIVCIDNEGTVLGYAYAGAHHQRMAYRWSVNVSIYLATAARRQGIGTKLYLALFGILKDLGYVNAYAGITLPNEGSVAIHRGLDFIEVGVYEKVGFKGGKWHDVMWMARNLVNHEDNPSEPVKFSQYSYSEN